MLLTFAARIKSVMTEKVEITDFVYWLIPSGEGAIYLEGMPTEEERAAERRITADLRKKWQPDETATVVYKKLKSLEGKQIVVQLWNAYMVYSMDEGPLPFSCELLNVFTKEIKEEDRDFNQLFIEIRNPQNIHNGNHGGSSNIESNFNPEKGTYTFNCSSFSSVTTGYK
jgi:hypothetical protein